MNAGTAPIPEIEALRAEIQTLRQTITDDRIERARNHIEKTRNWLAFYTATMTVVLLALGGLGIKGYSDIQTSKERVDAKVSSFDKASADLEERIKATNVRLDLSRKTQEQFDILAAQNREVLARDKTIVEGFSSSMKALESKQAFFKGDTERVQGELNRIQQSIAQLSQTVSDAESSALSAHQTSTSLSSVLASSVILTTPFITDTNLSASTLTIKGNNFGTKIGRVFCRMSFLGERVELPMPGRWSDNEIQLTLNEAELEKTRMFRRSGPGRGSVECSIETATGTQSNWSISSGAPAPPTNLRIVPQ